MTYAFSERADESARLKINLAWQQAAQAAAVRWSTCVKNGNISDCPSYLGFLFMERESRSHDVVIGKALREVKVLKTVYLKEKDWNASKIKHPFVTDSNIIFVEITLRTIRYDDVTCLAMVLPKIWSWLYSQEDRKLISGDQKGGCTLLALWLVLSLFWPKKRLMHRQGGPKITDGILIIFKQLKSVLKMERYELPLRWKVIKVPTSYGFKQNETVDRVLLDFQAIS